LGAPQEDHGHGDHTTETHDKHSADHADHAEHGHDDTDHAEHHDDPCGLHAAHHTEDEDYDPAPAILHHIADANEWHITEGVTIPLPCIAFVKGEGLKMFMSSIFHHGENAHDGFIMNHNRLMKIEEQDFPMGDVHLHNEGHFVVDEESGKALLCHEGQIYHASRHDVIRNGFSFSWFDFSITKNVATLFITALIMIFLFMSVAGAYRRRAGLEPRGLQNFMEPLIEFVRDDIAIPNLGDRAPKYLPYLMVVFFFIWIANMLGQLPFIGNPNLTGNITVTLVLSLITFVLTNINGSKDYWVHTLTAPGTPFLVKLILVPIEILGVFTKPFALMIRLFANISAGHIIVMSLVSLIFVFGNVGQSLPGSIGGAALAVPFVIFMGLIELLVAFLQAFIFTMLSALFIGLATETHAH
jgi:F-type H+-transporting ATPase subunit a